MTESEWLTAESPQRLLDWVARSKGTRAHGMGGFENGYQITRRKLYLLYAALCAHIGSHDRACYARNKARYPEGKRERLPSDSRGPEIRDYLDQLSPQTLLNGLARDMGARPNRTACNAIREILGYPHRPWQLPHWQGKSCLTQQIKDLADGALASANFLTGVLDPTEVSVLADALEEVGWCDLSERCPICQGSGKIAPISTFRRQSVTCPTCHGLGTVMVAAPLLTHLRHEVQHLEGCWVIDILAQRE